MRERKYIKLRSDMYDDTKFKIIDTMEDRDAINYIWTRILTLCGKINNEYGYLLVSKDMPYTVEILSIEFNRRKEQIEHALSVFIDLNMISKDEDDVIQVCNFNKHQVSRKKKDTINKEEVECKTKKDSTKEIYNKEEKKDNKIGDNSNDDLRYINDVVSNIKSNNNIKSKNNNTLMKFINEDLKEIAVDKINKECIINEKIKVGIG